MDRLDALRAFVRTVELGTVSAAAAELRVGQSTVSKWLAALEEELGATLLERTTRRHRLTEAGEVLLERARVVIAAFDDARAAVGGAAPTLRGRLRVSLPVVFGRLHVVPHLPRFLAAHPALAVELVFSDRYVDLIEEGVDVAVRVGVPEDSSYRARTLGQSRRRLVAAPAYLAEHGTPSRVKDLEQHRCLSHTGLRPAGVWTFGRGSARSRVRVAGGCSANHSDSLRILALAGEGIALLADWLVDGDVASGALVAFLDDAEPPPAPVQALFAPSRFVPPKTRAFLDFLEETVGRSLAEGRALSPARAKRPRRSRAAAPRSGRRS